MQTPKKRRLSSFFNLRAARPRRPPSALVAPAPAAGPACSRDRARQRRASRAAALTRCCACARARCGGCPSGASGRPGRRAGRHRHRHRDGRENPPPPPPKLRGARSRRLVHAQVAPTQLRPSSCWIACVACSALANVTNANPRGRPLSRSVGIDDLGDLAERCEQRLDLLARRVEAEVPDEHLAHSLLPPPTAGTSSDDSRYVLDDGDPSQQTANPASGRRNSAAAAPVWGWPQSAGAVPGSAGGRRRLRSPLPFACRSR